MGFTFPFEFWLRQKLKREVEYTFKEKNSILDEFLDERASLDIWQNFLRGRISWQRPWAIYVLRKWVKMNLE
jgi:hypothetical protein